jgi:hypothetical protein
VEWEALERKLATGGHDGHVSDVLFSQHIRERHSLFVPLGPVMGSQDGTTYRRCAQRAHKMDYVSVLGTNTHVGAVVSSFPPRLTFPDILEILRRRDWLRPPKMVPSKCGR